MAMSIRCLMLLRSSQGFAWTKATPVFDAFVLVRMLKPEAAATLLTAGLAARIFSTFLSTASVRSFEAASGSWMLTKK